MARKSNDELYTAFLTDVLAHVPADVKADAEKVLKHESVTSKLKESVLARADYSREMDALKDARTELDSEVAEARKNIDGWTKWYEKANSDYTVASSKLKKYEDEFGPLDSDDSKRKQPALSPDDYKKLLNEELQKHDIAAIAFANDLMHVKFDYFKQFNEVLDTDKLIEAATKKNQTIKMAYDDFVAPKVKEREEKRFTDAISKAKEEGAKEALASHRLPFVSGPTEPHTIDSMPKTPSTPEDRVTAAVARWQTIRSGAST